MDILRIVITVLFVIDCIALTVLVLMQEGKQQGLGSIAGVADTYWGKNKGRSMEGGTEEGNCGYRIFVLYSGRHPESEFLTVRCPEELPAAALVGKVKDKTLL